MSELSSDIHTEVSPESAGPPLPALPAPSSLEAEALSRGGASREELRDQRSVPAAEGERSGAGARPIPARVDRGNASNARNRRNGRAGRGGGGGDPQSSRGRETPAPPTLSTAPTPAGQTPLSAEPAPPNEPPSVCFISDGLRWIACVAGRSASGRGRPGVGAPLLLITFTRADDPDHPPLEVLHVGRGLDDLGDLELTELLRRARPAPPAKEREELFSDTNARKRVDR